MQRIGGFGDNALYKSTFYLLTYLHTYTGCIPVIAMWLIVQDDDDDDDDVLLGTDDDDDEDAETARSWRR